MYDIVSWFAYSNRFSSSSTSQWDLSGADQFESLREQYYPYGDVISINYDATNRKSFDNVRTWVRKVRRYNTKARLELVGHKCDLVDKIVVSEAEDHRLAKELGLASSARTSNVVLNIDNYVIH
ncbi:hypothetical protein BV25DRAFT_1804676 [Artomyces pyxidatus]|uniref:Uncharacterized protein n=1 Tax=Artomyces pyxidatus TaxID=48021 RepID=A0ACB8T1U5_9AGAM|nr:hypothetical protein BV25DRAFT_1804676 [Artomyces pyxidatus]